jgi:ribonuclease D
MILGSLTDTTFIADPHALQHLAEALCREPIVAVDTESNSLFAYREQVCLIQFSTPTTDYLLDPLEVDDLSPLADFFGNPEIEKVFHAAEYDIICLKRDFHFEFTNLFDTMIAARILGRTAVGLGAMLETEFGIKMDKRHQRADWGQRPLPSHLLDYARLDTHYLIPLRDRMQQELVEKGLWQLAHEDFLRICLTNCQVLDEKIPPCWRISGAHDLAPQQAAILLELCRYRDRSAKALNRPLFKVMNDQTLLAIAQTAPTNLDQLGQVQGMSHNQLMRHGYQLLESVQRGLQARPIYPRRTPRPSDQFLNRLERLRQWRKQAGLKMGVNSDVVLPRDLLLILAEKNPSQMDELAVIMHDVPWRLENFGDHILQELQQKGK